MENTSFIDQLRNGLAGKFSGTLDPVTVILTLLLACVMGLFLLFIYRKTFAGVLYSRTFGLSLVLVTIITALIILPIVSNVTLSLGMVGALSIVRFRTAVKDAMDTMFMFWGIAIGICLGSGFWQVGIIGSLVVGLCAVLITSVKFKGSMPYLLVVHYSEGANQDVRRLLSKLPNYKLKSKTVRGDNVELTVEVRLTKGQDMYVDQFMTVEGVYDASLMSYQGDIIS